MISKTSIYSYVKYAIQYSPCTAVANSVWRAVRDIIRASVDYSEEHPVGGSVMDAIDKRLRRYEFKKRN
jgi:hypothetical protein